MCNLLLSPRNLKVLLQPFTVQLPTNRMEHTLDAILMAFCLDSVFCILEYWAITGFYRKAIALLLLYLENVLSFFVMFACSSSVQCAMFLKKNES